MPYLLSWFVRGIAGEISCGGNGINYQLAFKGYEIIVIVKFNDGMFIRVLFCRLAKRVFSGYYAALCDRAHGSLP